MAALTSILLAAGALALLVVAVAERAADPPHAGTAGKAHRRHAPGRRRGSLGAGRRSIRRRIRRARVVVQLDGGAPGQPVHRACSPFPTSTRRSCPGSISTASSRRWSRACATSFRPTSSASRSSIAMPRRCCASTRAIRAATAGCSSSAAPAPTDGHERAAGLSGRPLARRGAGGDALPGAGREARRRVAARVADHLAERRRGCRRAGLRERGDAHRRGAGAGEEPRRSRRRRLRHGGEGRAALLPGELRRADRAAEPAVFQGPARPPLRAGAARAAAVRAAVHRSRQLQEHQRQPRPRGGRRGAAADRGAPEAMRARDRHGDAPRRRRVHDHPVADPLGPRSGVGRRARPAVDGGAVRHRRQRALPECEHRHRALPGGRQRRPRSCCATRTPRCTGRRRAGAAASCTSRSA